ncbi:MAG: hypothetical protein AAFR01_08610, partial [Pseudomonadota bacterium]
LTISWRHVTDGPHGRMRNEWWLMMSIDSKLCWSQSGYYTDQDVIRTPRTSIATEHVDLVDVRQPFLAPSILSGGILVGLAARFSDVLTGPEIIAMIGISAVAVAAGISVARLKLKSFSIQDVDFFLPVWIARPMRRSIENAVREREQNRGDRKRKS